MASGRSKTKKKRSGLPPVNSKAISNLRKKRVVVDFATRIEIVKLIKTGLTEHAVVEELKSKYNIEISRSTVHRISEKSDDLVDSFENKKFRPDAKVLMSRVAYPELNQAVYDWFVQMRNPGNGCKPLPISKAVLQQRAMDEATLRGILNFRASNGWFENWKKMFAIGDSVRLFGEAGDVDMSVLKPLIADLKRKLSMFQRKNIFNMDESGLLFRTLPSRTYLARSDGNRQDVRMHHLFYLFILRLIVTYIIIMVII